MADALQTYVDNLLAREIVQEKSRGAQNSKLEVAQVLQAIALNLALHPRAVLHLAFLARNALQTLVAQERQLVTDLTQIIDDLGNPSFVINDTKALQRAKVSIGQVFGQESLSAHDQSIKDFNAAIDEFMRKQLLRNIRRAGSTEMARPYAEAKLLLPGKFADLKARHAEVVRRAEYLESCVRNFVSANISSVVGMETVSRIKDDIDEILAAIEESDSPDRAGEYAQRLTAAKSCLQLLQQSPGIYDPKVDVSENLPHGSDIFFRSPMTYVSVSLPYPAPWTFPQNASLQVSTDSGVTSMSFPMQTASFEDKVALVGTPIVGNPVFAAPSSLYLEIGASQYEVVVPAGGYTFPQLLVALQAAAAGVPVEIASYISSGNPQLCLLASDTIRVLPFHWNPNNPAPNDSIHTELGFEPGQEASVHGATEAILTDAFARFGLTPVFYDDRVEVGYQGQYLEMIGIPQVDGRAHRAQSDRCDLYGIYLGEDEDPIDPRGLVDVGDVLSLGATVTEVGPQFLTLSAALDRFDQRAVLESVLVLAWKSVQDKLSGFMSSWKVRDLTRLDAVIAPLNGSPTKARREDAKDALAVLDARLGELEAAISGAFPQTLDASVATGVLDTVRERKLDRAEAFLLSGRVSEIFKFDWETASFSGSLMSSMSDVAKNDVIWPNSMRDENGRAFAVDPMELDP